MRQLQQFLKLAGSALLLAVLSFSQNTPFYSVSTASQTTFSKPANYYATLQVSKGSIGAANLPAGDPIIGMPFQVLPSWGNGMVDCDHAKSSYVPFLYGGSGYVIFPDGQGGGVGWQFASVTGAWFMQKANGKWVIQVNLVSPYWLASPTQNTSPTLIQMMNASSATLTLTLSALPHSKDDPNNISLKQFCSLGTGTSVTSYTYSSSGSIDLYR